MELKRNYKGLKPYEALLKTICCTDDYSLLTDSEWEGCLGVACVISMIEGITPNMFSLSKHLDIPHYDIHLQHTFERLRINGIFGSKYGAKIDPALNGNADYNEWQTGAEVERNAWCMIAGVAGGHMGMTEEKDRLLENVNVEV
jgi:hypothetical protein